MEEISINIPLMHLPNLIYISKRKNGRICRINHCLSILRTYCEIKPITWDDIFNIQKILQEIQQDLSAPIKHKAAPLSPLRYITHYLILLTKCVNLLIESNTPLMKITFN
jgi:hypothetical protein